MPASRAAWLPRTCPPFLPVASPAPLAWPAYPGCPALAAGLKGDGPASLDDLRQVAEAIDLYFQ